VDTHDRVEPATASVPPQNLEAEESVLGAMMIAPAAITAVSDILDASDFYRDSHARIYRAALTLTARGEPVDAITLTDTLEETGELEKVGGRVRLHELAKIVPASANAGHYARIVKETATLRGFIRAGGELARLGWDRPAEIDELRERARQLFTQLETGSADGQGEPHSWTPVDLVASDTAPPEPPTIGGIVYPGRRHLFSGEPESLKSWLLLILCVDEMQAGRNVFYIDHEMGQRDTLERLRHLGATDQQIADHLTYLEPDQPMTSHPILRDVQAMLEARQPTLICIDAFIGALDLHGCDPNSGQDVERFYRSVVNPLRAHGAAIVILDHLPKDKENRGKFAIGSERKVGAADVHLRFDVTEPFGRGKTGRANLTTKKDRPGYLSRPRAAELELASDPDTNDISHTLTISEASSEPHTDLRPTVLMEKISRYLESQDGQAVSRAIIDDAVIGKAKYKRLALTLLVSEGYAAEEDGPRNARLTRICKPYREAEDPTSSHPSRPRPDLVPDGVPMTSSHLVPPRPPLKRGRDEVDEVDGRQEPLPEARPRPAPEDEDDGWLEALAQVQAETNE
jgi:hypothetical protein